MRKVILILMFICIYAISNGQYAYKFEAPKNKIDSIDINLKMTKLCLLEFKKQINDSYFYYLAGLGITSIGYGVNFKLKTEEKGLTNTNYILMGVGGAFFIIGFINHIDSFKWIKRAGIEPVLTPDGAHVYINF